MASPGIGRHSSGVMSGEFWVKCPNCDAKSHSHCYENKRVTRHTAYVHLTPACVAEERLAFQLPDAQIGQIRKHVKPKSVLDCPHSYSGISTEVGNQFSDSVWLLTGNGRKSLQVLISLKLKFKTATLQFLSSASQESQLLKVRSPVRRVHFLPPSSLSPPPVLHAAGQPAHL